MIDEKKIEEAANKCADNALKEVSFRCFDDVKTGATLGISWVLDNLWHVTKDIPEKDRMVLILFMDNRCMVTRMFSQEVIGNDMYNQVKRWLYIDDLMKGNK